MTIQFAFNITLVVSQLALVSFLTNYFSFSLSHFVCPLLLPGPPLLEVFNPAGLFTFSFLQPLTFAQAAPFEVFSLARLHRKYFLSFSILMGSLNSLPSKSERMAAPLENNFFARYGPSQFGLNFPLGSVMIGLVSFIPNLSL